MDMDKLTEHSEADFLHHYQQTVFKENSADDFVKCKFKRQSTHQILQMAQKVSSNEVTCQILKTKLQDYSAVVDKTDGVNNYADAVLELVSHNSCDSQKWVSSANASELLKEYLKPSPGECYNKSTEGCLNRKPTKAQLKAFLKNKRPFPTTLDFPSRPSVQPVLQHPSAKAIARTPSFSSSKLQTLPVKRIADESKHSHQDSKLMTAVANRVFGTVKPQNAPSFRTAGSELKLQNAKKYGQQGQARSSSCGGSDSLSYGTNKKSLGGRTRSVNSKFIPPVKSNSQEENEMRSEDGEGGELEDERLRLIDPKLVDLIRSEIMDQGPPIHWDHIAGLNFAKATIQEIVVLPMLRPDIFTGLRRPPKGILLFGPPGTGKTLIGKCIASQSQSTFFNISASSLTSKWVGEGEKMVRTLFTLARIYQPAVVFIDEIDSLLSQRSDTEHESSRRIKTEFLVQLDGAGTGEEDRILVIGATNRPQELDEAARRRLVKRLYIPLPDHLARCQMVQTLMSSERHVLSDAEVEEIAALTDGYSGADMKTLCQEACLGPIRAISFSEIQHITADQVRPVTVEDFKAALHHVRSTVSPKDLETYVTWDQTYGSGGAPK